MRAGTTIRVRGEGGAEWDQDVPADGTPQRVLLDDMIAAGHMFVISAPADAAREPVRVARPGVREPKAEWVTWAVAHGYAPAIIAKMSKADIQALPDSPEFDPPDGLLVVPEPGQEDVDPGEGGSHVGAGALVDQEGTKPEQVGDRPAIGDGAEQQLDGDDGIVGQGTDGT